MSKLPEGLGARYWAYDHTSFDDTGSSLRLAPHETWIGSWSDVGLYEGNRKVPPYQLLTIHLTTHRLILSPSLPAGVAADQPGASSHLSRALATELRHVRQTEFYTGFMRSSPKITLTLGAAATAAAFGSGSGSASASDGDADGSRGAGVGAGNGTTSWVCAVCGFANPPGGASAKCELCGVAGQRRAGAGAGSVPSSATATPEPSAEQSGAPSSGGKEVACPTCTFLNHPSLRNCEICGAALPRRHRPSSKGSGTKGDASRHASGDGMTTEEPRSEVVRLSFRKGGAPVAYAKIKTVLGQKAWERDDTIPHRSNTPGASPVPDSGSGSGTATPRAGIDSVLQALTLSSQSRTDNLSSAFADLDALMVRAGEMVRLAQNLNERLSAQQAQRGVAAGAGDEATREEESLIRSSLVQLGLPAPALTSDMVRSDQAYYEGLAKELGALLVGSAKGGREGLMMGREGRGVIGLDEVWGLWMRARGVALLSPSTLISVLPFLAAHTSPAIRSHILPSGLNVLYTPTYEPRAILGRLLAALDPHMASSTPGEEWGVDEREKSLSILEIAAMEGLAIGLAQEMMEEIEKLGAGKVGGGQGLVRDDQAEQGAGGVRWYRDIITPWQL